MLAAALACLVLQFSGAVAQAAAIRIVALGASNTAGRGVAAQEAYPAQLEAMLRAKGYNATVTNAGLNGDTTAGMLARLDSAVPNGTQLVLVSPSANDAKHGIAGEQAANVSAIVSRLRARGIKALIVPGLRNLERQPDGEHLTAAAHRALAASLLPQVIGAIGR
jgi:acyl-CoA thioesterase-1